MEAFMTLVVKSTGQSEAFNAGKLVQSLYSTMLSARTPPGAARMIAQRTVDDVRLRLQKNEVTTADVRRLAAQQLAKYNPRAAYTYKQQDSSPHFHAPYAPDSPRARTSFLHQQDNPHSHWWESDRRDY
jgi:transcriptional regulator NrdR family protein